MIAMHEQIDRFAIIRSSYGGIVLQSLLHMVHYLVSHVIIANTGTISDDLGLVKLLNRRLSLIRIFLLSPDDYSYNQDSSTKGYY